MRRREFFSTVVGLSAIPFIPSSLGAESAEVPHEEPFEGYEGYIRRLGEHVGEVVRVQNSFNFIGGGRTKLLGLERFDNSNTKLFPHRVSFDDGSTINLIGIVSITEPSVPQVNVNPTDENTFYLHIPGQRAYEESRIRRLEALDKDYRRFG
jgi:hypothetical protein